MTKLEKIEQDIASLSKSDLQKLSDWLEQYKAGLWDKQIEEDAKSGKLDKLFAEAEADIAAGKIRPL
jgi:flagellar motility protein MotE (MotC chaperone)